MTRSSIYAAVLATAWVGGASAAFAHHGWGGYDSAQVLTFTGTVREFAYQNPHASLVVEAPGKTWSVVLAPPFRMANRGLPADAIKPGDTVTVEGYPSRSDPQELRAERIRTGEKTTELR